MRMVLDTAVLVAALRSNAGASRQLLVAALEKRYTLLVSVPLLVEYEAVLTRPNHLEAAGISAEDVGVILDAVAAVAEPVRLVFLWRPVLRDPADEMVLETAVNGRANLLVTFNQRDFGAAAGFGPAVMLPGEALQYLEGKR